MMITFYVDKGLEFKTIIKKKSNQEAVKYFKRRLEKKDFLELKVCQS